MLEKFPFFWKGEKRKVAKKRDLRSVKMKEEIHNL